MPQVSGTGTEYELLFVTYHSRPELSGLLDAIPLDCPLVIVDNSVGADGVHELLSNRPRGRYIEGPEEGFATAANLAARTSRFEYLIFVNPDTRPTPDIFDQLVADLAADPGLAAVAAATTESNGHIALGVGGWEPSVTRTLAQVIGLHKLWPRVGLWASPEVGESIDLDWMTGACIAMRREDFLALGGFDERYFVYGEDVTFGRTLREHGYRQRLRTDLLVPHSDAGSGADRTQMLRLRGASMTIYLRRNHGRARAEIMRWLLVLGSFARFVLYARRQPRGRHEWAYLLGLIKGSPLSKATADSPARGRL